MTGKDPAVNQTILPRIARVALACAAFLAPSALVAAAQDATPVGSAQEMEAEVLEVPLMDAEENAVGLAIFTEVGGEVLLQVLMEGLTPGQHGWHLHETGICDPAGPEPFASAGGHWNPTEMPHGAPDAPEHHAGDFGNFMATEEGLAEVVIASSEFTLGEGPNSVFDEDGTTIIIHAGQDDLTTQPSGDSGARFACGVVAEPMAGAATPMAGAATPMAAATPVA